MLDDKNIFTKLDIIHDVVEEIANTTDGEDYAGFMMSLFEDILNKNEASEEEQTLKNRNDENLNQAIEALKSEITANPDAAKARIEKYREDYKSSTAMSDEGGS
jgi:hypothetical protein